jgi:hypothetical protein
MYHFGGETSWKTKKGPNLGRTLLRDRLCDWEVNGTSSGSCPMADFGISDFELWGAVTTAVLVN